MTIDVRPVTGAAGSAFTAAQKSFFYLTLASSLEYAAGLCLAPPRFFVAGLFAEDVRC
jgi:hypothetical protein